MLAREERRGRGAERLIVPALNDLIEVSVVDPDALAVADQQLLVRLLDGPAELAWPCDRELAACLLLGAAVGVGHGLSERRTCGLRIVHERAQSFDRRRVGDRRDEKQQERTGVRFEQHPK